MRWWNLVADHWKMPLSPNGDLLYPQALVYWCHLSFLLCLPSYLTTVYNWGFLKKIHGEIQWSQEQKEKTTIFISGLMLHTLKYALAVDFGKWGQAYCINYVRSVLSCQSGLLLFMAFICCYSVWGHRENLGRVETRHEWPGGHIFLKQKKPTTMNQTIL